jgi:hypothetical protein
MVGHVSKIARQEGVEFRSVRHRLEDDGGIKMEAQAIGSTVAESWGNDEYEFWVHVPPASVSKLLLREKFSGQLGPVDGFRDWCRAQDASTNSGSWV